MGTDIKISLGRITQKTLTDGTQPTGTEIALLGGKTVNFGDIYIEHFDPDESVVPYEGLNRCYDLFGFIAGVRGNVKPMIDHMRLREQTRAFVKWLYEEKIKDLESSLHPWDLARYNLSEFGYELGLSEHSWCLYPTAALWAFDYDQRAVIRSRQNLEYHLCPEGRSYRDRIDEQWFVFLNMLRRDNWDFVIFSFD